jgi:hypothetical protein
MSVKIQVNRTFSPYVETDETHDVDHEYWLQRLGHGHASLSWRDLSDKDLAVIVGEAGIGKTFEFRAQVERMQAEGKSAFFLPLSQLSSVEQTNLELTAGPPYFQKWLGSNQPGYFFLDAVDEARLVAASTLQTALRSVVAVLRPNLNRAHFFISSRITDWNVDDVQDTVKRTLLQAVRDGRAVAQTQLNPAESAGTPPAADTLLITSTKESTASDLPVFSLNPLSTSDAKKFAEAYGATPVDAFWSEIEDGDYEFMATRPLDLKWMAERWRSGGRLGSYADLIESAVLNRLTEVNPSYIDSGAVLSADRLRQGAEHIAAGCVFSGRPLVLVPPTTALNNSVAAFDILRDWTPQEIQRLLGTAVFDEATYGRVRFHHRAVREYLAACWVNRRLKEGLPLRHALSLFIRTQYGKTLLLNSRRATVCWLATLNPQVREEVIRQFPEMLMFEGDPLRWSTDDVVQAFRGYLRRLEAGYRPNWWNDASELRRVAHKLPPQLLSDLLTQYSRSPEVFNRLLSLVRHGRIYSCANAIFAIYRARTTTLPIRRHALDVLSVVATLEQRATIAADLVAGKLEGNELISQAICVVDLRKLTVRQLTKILQSTGPESEFGSGPMVKAIKHDMLPTLDRGVMHRLLAAILAALPKGNIKELIRRAESPNDKEAWMLTVLPAALLRALEMSGDETADIPKVVMGAVLIVEGLRDTIYFSEEDFRALRAEIEKNPGFRKRIAINISRSGDFDYSVIRMTLLPGLVAFKLTDLDWVVGEANRKEIDPSERQLWYEIAREIAFTHTSGIRRNKVLESLVHGPDKKARIKDIGNFSAQRRAGLQQQRRYTSMENQRKTQRRKELLKNKTILRRNITVIRDGSSQRYIQWLVQYALKQISGGEYTQVSLEPIARDLGNVIAAALSDGLTRFWRQETIPNPADYSENQVPWSGIIGLAGINHEVSLGLDVRVLTTEEVSRAVQLTVWGFGKVEPWLDLLAETRVDTVTAALMPSFEHELSSTVDRSGIPRVTRHVLDYPQPIREPFLRRALELLRDAKIPNEELQRKLFRAAGESNMIPEVLISKYAARHLKASAGARQLGAAAEWFQLWAATNFAKAWSWIENNTAADSKDAFALATLVAQALEYTDWVKYLSGTEAEANALVSMFGFLMSNSSTATAEVDADDRLRSIQQLRDSIPGILANRKGRVAHAALERLIREQGSSTPRGWLERFVTEHAASEAEQLSIVSPTDLFLLGDVYCRDPRTEGELFEQVVARLTDIRERIEGGPFSDRDLFRCTMEEKHLQLWLAARMSDTPHRRFTARFAVHREPQVDDDKRTDIEVSSQVGKVCIEIKPVDRGRGYSANSLAGTVRDQLVGQYLRGQNSRHGILVLFRLDTKRWRIPGKPTLGTFLDLAEYIRKQAAAIEASCSDVEKVLVIGIDCVGET